MVSFQVVAWHGEDTDSEYVIHIFGRTEDGKSVHVETPFEPYFFVKVPPDRSPKALIQEIQPYSSAVIRRKDLWGFRNQEEYTFLKLGFRTLADLKECRPRGLKVYEKNLDPVLRFMHRSEIKSTGWVQVPANAGPGHDSSCDIDVCVADWRTLKPVDRDDIAPLRIASLDIESYSESGAFPNAFKTNDTCFQVAVTTKSFGHKEYFDRKCFCVKQTNGSECESFDTEREMLERLGRYLRELDPDIVTGWNIFGFDLEYLYTRAVVTGAGPDAHMWGRLRGIPNELVVKHLASNALGSNDLKMVPMLGRYVFDMFQDIKREHKLESYSLNNVSKEFLKDQKIDMPVKEMFSRFRDGDPVLLGEVADYCIKDTELPHRISEKLCLIQNLIEMAKATWVPLSYLSERGQQIKVFSQMARKARELGFMIPTMYSKATSDEKYQGATVLDAQTGAYYGPITALDFASLYPSIMRAHNLCYSSLVIDPRFGNVPGVVYEQYGPYRFAQGVSSLLPAILNELAAFRKKAKKLMAQSEGTPMEAVYNGQQLAYKISMNSIYGFTGAAKGMLPCVAIASTVTMRGRQMIEETKNYVEEHFPGAKVRYGDTDSVMVEFDVQGRKGQEAIDYSWEQGELASEQCSKLFKAPNELELEKVYSGYFLYSKKRYAGRLYEKKGDKVVFKKIDIKGLQVVRRDSCPFVRETLRKLLTLMLESSNPRPVIELARDSARELINGKVPIEKLLMSKQLASDYKVPMPHVTVRDKMRERAPGSEPQQGDRVPFVIVKGHGRMFEKAEDPTWVAENNVPIDYEYYFTNQFKKPVQDLLEPLISVEYIFDNKFMAKTMSTVEVQAKRAFLSMFASKTT